MPRDMNGNEIEWQITEATKGSKRTVQIHGYRRSRARLLRELSDSMVDASREIDRAYEERETKNNLGAKTADLIGARGGISMFEEIMEAMNTRIDNLIKWENSCPKFLRDTVYALNQFGHTSTSYSDLTGKTTLEITLWYKEGLRMYVKLRGWE